MILLGLQHILNTWLDVEDANVTVEMSDKLDFMSNRLSFSNLKEQMWTFSLISAGFLICVLAGS